MGFLRTELSTLHVVEGVFPWLPPSPKEVRDCDSAAFVAGNLDKSRVLHEYFLLKAALGLEYGLGLLQTLGLREEGLEQYRALYIQRLAEGVVAVFPSEREVAIGVMAGRIKTYGGALHGALNNEDPHLGVADAFTRFCGAPDDRALVPLCLDACKAMHARFINELAEMGRETKT